MQMYRRLRNVLRNKLQRTFIGEAWINLTSKPQSSICFVSATRLSEKDFWRRSLLGRSLGPRLNQTTIKARIAYENTQGLPTIYNKAIREEDAEILVFLHDDLWLEDPKVMQKIRAALKINDILGIAGNIRRVKGQPAWLFLRGTSGKLELDRPNLSGAIKHGNPGQSEKSVYGHAPAACELMDGVFLAAKRQTLIKSRTYFDEQFKFDFYDMDFCRTAKQNGLSLTTWPIDLIHQSSGLFGGPSWMEMEATYQAKWKN